MKFIRRIFIWTAIIFCVSYIAAYGYVRWYGQAIIKKVFLYTLKKDVTLGNICYQFPLGIHADEVVMDDSLKAKAIDVQLQFISIFFQKAYFSSIRLIEPVINIEKIEEVRDVLNKEITSEALPPTNDQALAPPPNFVKADVKKPFGLKIKHLLLQNGQVHYSRHLPDSAKEKMLIGGSTFSFTFKDVFLQIDDLVFPLISEPMNFQVKGILAENSLAFSEYSVESLGWIDFFGRNMDGSVKVRGEDGQMNLMADLTSQNNHMKVQGDLKLKTRAKEQVKENGLPGMNVSKAAMPSLGIDLKAKFSFETKMDDFEISHVPFSGSMAAK